MTTLTYRGIPLAQDASVSFTMAMTEESIRSYSEVSPADRTIIVTLQKGQRWPDEMKRGRPVIFEVNGSRFRGRIRYRRMHRLVVRGIFDPLA